MKTTDLLTIGELGRRSGMAASALRYYEELGLITSTRTSSGQRRFERSTLRRPLENRLERQLAGFANWIFRPRTPERPSRD